ncbi:MAG: chemotaxis protein CheW [Prochloraceae cyanobacterium]|nr:chemotaxis protein CheW [Prochloraceae cyanobacterium]
MSNSVDRNIVTVGIVDKINTEENKNLQKFLQFQLNSQTRVLLPAERVTEILKIAETEILPIPEMGDRVMGIYSWRTEMLWIIDLRHLFGSAEEMDTSELKRLYLMTIVIEFNGHFLGFCVYEINDILELNCQDMHLECQDLFSEELLPFIAGYFIDRERQLLTLLKLSALFDWQ